MSDTTTAKSGLVPRRDIEDEIAGFKDWHPHHAMLLEKVLDVIRTEYRKAGFAPLYTPLVERPSVLQAKAEGRTGQQIYGLRLLNPAPDSPTDEKALAVRFDHTVPLVRYTSARMNELQFPFRRYDIGPVMRGESPKDGRYREFIQADIDVIGKGVLSFDNDAEMVAIINSVFEQLNFGDFTIRINNRKILTGFLKSIGCESDEEIRQVRNVIDEVEKVGIDETLNALEKLGVNETDARRGLDLLTKEYSTEEVFELLKKQPFEGEFAEGVKELEYVIEAVRMFGVPERRFRVDLSLARGLDYYTSTVYEARLNDHPKLGSIAGGGRFDNLAEKLSSEKLPGVGISIGVDRLLRRLIKAKLLDANVRTHARVFVASRGYLSEKSLHFNRVKALRAAGINSEVSLDETKLGKQIQDAVKKGMEIVVFTHNDHPDDKIQYGSGHVVVRNVRLSKQKVLPENDFVEFVRIALDADRSSGIQWD